MSKRAVKKKKPVKTKALTKATKKKSAPPKKAAPKAKKTAKVLKLQRRAVTAPTPVVPAPAPEVVAPPVLSSVPPRAPMRRIIGADKTITIVPKVQAVPPVSVAAEVAPAATTLAATSAPTPIPAVVAEKNPMQSRVARLRAEVDAQRVAWTELPKFIPAHVRFLMTAIQNECKKASEWPFPFAKFISALPEETCGLKFAMVLMHLDQDIIGVAKACDMDVARAQALIESGNAMLDEQFVSKCPDMHRKWRANLGGGVGVSSLIEQYSLARVDPNLQLLLGSILFKGMDGAAWIVDVERVGEHWLSGANASSDILQPSATT